MKTGLETIFLDEVETVREELGTASKFEDPNVQTISAKQMQAFNNEIAEIESSYHENFNSRYVMTIQEQRNLNKLEALLANTAGRNAEASMPIDATQQADELPKQLIFRSRMEPQDPTSINRLESDSSSTIETEGQGMAPSELLPKVTSDESTGLRSSDSADRWKISSNEK